MRKMSSKKCWLTGVLCLAFSVKLASAQVVELAIYVEKPSFSHDEAIPVFLVIKTPEQSSAVFYIAGFVPEIERGQPISHLLFDIRRFDGTRVGRLENKYFVRSAAPSYRHFFELTPRSFFGMPFYVNREPFAYDLGRAGKYKLKAMLTFRAKEWQREYGKDVTSDGAAKTFSDELLVDGTVESNEIEIEILEKKEPCE